VLLAVVITFSADHSAPLGLLTFGVFGVLAGAVITAFAFRSEKGAVRMLQIIQGVLTAAVGLGVFAAMSAGLPFLVFAVSGWAVITGFLELYVGVRTRRTSPIARDHIFIGGLTVLLAVVILVVPPELAQPYTVDDTTYYLTSSIVVVGLLGAYWAIMGVFLIIAAFSVKWADAPAPVTPTAETGA